MIKRLFIFLTAFALSALSVLADDSEKITLTVGALKVIDLPFVMQNYRPSTKGIIRIENFSERQLRIIGEKQGLCELEVSGGGLIKLYSINVVDNISEILKQLQNDLDSLPELDLSINQDYIVIRGEVCSISNWEHLRKVLEMPKFKDCCQNYAKFRPAPEIILTLKKLLEQSGFTFTDSPVPKSPGEISLQYANNVLTISGNVYQVSDIETINNILATQTWLSVGKEKADEGKVLTIVKLKTVPTTLWIDVVFIALNKQDADRIGSNSVPTASAAFSSFYDMITGRGDGNTAMIGGNMNATVQFLASNGITRMHDAGCVVLKSNDPNGTTQHIGGKKYVKVSGVENGSLQEIEYGLKLMVKGGLIAKNKVDLQFDVSNNGLISAGEEGTFDQTQEQVKNSVVCDLENTIVLGGYKKIVQDTAKSGLPVLRNTPVLKWFVSQDTDNQQEFNLLILACPRLQKQDANRKIALPVIDTITPATEDARYDNKTVIEQQKRYRGWLSWLNWFCW